MLSDICITGFRGGMISVSIVPGKSAVIRWIIALEKVPRNEALWIERETVAWKATSPYEPAVLP